MGLHESYYATREEVARLRNVVWDPGTAEHAATAFTPEELAWLEGADDDMDRYLARHAPAVLRALTPWTEHVQGFFRRTGGRIGYQGPARFLLYVESADELRNGQEGFEPVIDAYAYRGLKSLIVGLSKAGKSFTTWSKVADAVRAGKRVMYLSEEPRSTVWDKVQKFGLEEHYGRDFFVSRRQHEAIRLMSWQEVVKTLAQDVGEHRIDLVVIDTLRPWIGLEGEESNSADRVGQAVDALGPVCETGAAVVVIHQSPWDSKRARGSTEFHAAADLIFHIEGEGEEVRTIKYVGGRVEAVPPKQTFRWDGEHGLDLGNMRRDKAEHLDEVLRVLETAEDAMTADEISEQTDYSVRSVQKWLAELEDKEQVRRLPGSKAGPGGGRQPDRWLRLSSFYARLFAAAS